jgi:hypothetical protein
MSGKTRTRGGKPTHAPEPVLDGASLLASLDIHDLPSGLAACTEARQLLIDAGKASLHAQESVSAGTFVLAGMLARAQGFHQGATAAIEADNPYAAFTLLRSYAENAAALTYLIDKPQQIGRFLSLNQPPVKVGVLTTHARKHFEGFAGIYAQLSEYAHPASRSVGASHRITDETEDVVSMSWQSAPAFKAEGDRLIACAWVVELARAHHHLLREFGEIVRPDQPASENSTSD